ncbi:MAG: FoF1 ATP synthase subunit a [Patescibacteria group bacterium]|nr:F0F1 ATP synthase subunit A [Patescibacteria group bacterium]
MELNISLSPEILFNLGPIPVTNSLFWSLIISVFLMLFFYRAGRNLKTRPSKFQNLIELLIEESYKFTGLITNNPQRTKKIFPLVLTMFIFILACNLFTFMPGQSAVSIQTEQGLVPVFRAVMADYSMVFVLTAITVILVQIITILTNGPFNYLKKFINLGGPLKFFLGVMELIGELAKIISLSFRLFGNIFAGEVLGLVILSLIPFFVPLPFLFLSLLTSVIQAFVFSVLTLVFANMASQIPENE